MNKFITLKEAMEFTTLSRSTILRNEAEGLFPKKYKLSARRIAFLESEVQAWMIANPR